MYDQKSLISCKKKAVVWKNKPHIFSTDSEISAQNTSTMWCRFLRAKTCSNERTCKHIISINFSQLVIIIISSKAVWRKITSYNRSYIAFLGEREENLPLNHVHFHQAKPADQLFKKTKHVNKLYVFLHLYVIIKSSSKICNYLLFCKIVQK